MSLTHEILSFLDNCGVSAHPGDIVRHIPSLDVHHVTSLLKRLSEEGLVIETYNYYRITEKGIQAVREKETEGHSVGLDRNVSAPCMTDLEPTRQESDRIADWGPKK